VVVSDLPALREVVHPGETGLTFPSGDAAALADRVEGLIEDSAGRAALASAAREWVRSERTWSRNGERYRRLYADLGAA
jgi:glycosyltransferase involved in cell wall biosynthesis